MPSPLRLILKWKLPQDNPLLEDLKRFRARSRGRRMRYLARLGQHAESMGMSLEGQSANGELPSPVNSSPPRRSRYRWRYPMNHRHWRLMTPRVWTLWLPNF